MQFSFVIFILSFSFSASASAQSVNHFVRGKYSLEQGESKLCGEGDFYISKDRRILWLGPLYSFKTSAAVEKAPGGMANDKGCVYQLKTSYGSEENKTIITTVDTLQCGEITRHTVTTKVSISDGKISLDQTQVVNPKFHYNSGGVEHSCEWKFAKKN